MSALNPEGSRYSADVRMHLHLNGRVFSIGQLGPDFIILRNPADNPPADAEIAMYIDGRERRWTVHLPAAVAVGQPKTKTAVCARQLERD
jgi:hypothetical protein